MRAEAPCTEPIRDRLCKLLVLAVADSDLLSPHELLTICKLRESQVIAFSCLPTAEFWTPTKCSKTIVTQMTLVKWHKKKEVCALCPRQDLQMGFRKEWYQQETE